MYNIQRRRNFIGDGQLERPAVHEYTKAGTHTVTLTALKKEAPQERDATTFTVTIDPGPIDRVSLEPAEPYR